VPAVGGGRAEVHAAAAEQAGGPAQLGNRYTVLAALSRDSGAEQRGLGVGPRQALAFQPRGVLRGGSDDRRRDSLRRGCVGQ
jgi:hypothetical protein